MASKSKYRMLKGQELLATVALTTTVIKWLDLQGKTLGVIEPKQAEVIIKAGTFVGKCSPRRAIYIREQDTRQYVAPTHFLPDPYREGYYCGEGDPVIKAIPITSKTVDLWDKHYARERTNS